MPKVAILLLNNKANGRVPKYFIFLITYIASQRLFRTIALADRS